MYINKTTNFAFQATAVDAIRALARRQEYESTLLFLQYMGCHPHPPTTVMVDFARQNQHDAIIQIARFWWMYKMHATD